MNNPTRRSVFQAAAVAGAGAGVDAIARPRGRVTTFVFVTGANGVAMGDPELTLRGHRTVGVELPGHGPAEQFGLAYQAPQDLGTLAAAPSPVSGVTLDDYVEATVNVVRRVAAHGPVVLVGGSLGGAAVTKAADEVPHLIDRLVYDTAFCCTGLRSPAAYLDTPEAATSLAKGLAAGLIGDPVALGAVRINWRTADRAFLAAAKEALMAGASEGEFLAMLNTLLPDESLLVSAADARGRKNAWGRVPRTYIRHTRDRMIPLALQDRMIREADAATPDNPFEVRTVEAGHAATAAEYRRISEILDGLAK
ncbi:alpha/beta fold hydrolase [Nonomuraea spiralis]|uniref:Alpha/beta fold hydrolase n=1 Tax=Nonomuraea spiralis TaxID=46182 RepID=A0ABV5I8L4_9ACTN|nr:alpha/beta fold hydrolase [Nonomuraea spiralis]